MLRIICSIVNYFRWFPTNYCVLTAVVVSWTLHSWITGWVQIDRTIPRWFSEGRCRVFVVVFLLDGRTPFFSIPTWWLNWFEGHRVIWTSHHFPSVWPSVNPSVFMYFHLSACLFFLLPIGASQNIYFVLYTGCFNHSWFLQFAYVQIQGQIY